MPGRYAIPIAMILLAALPVRSDPLPSFEFRGHRIGEPIEKNFPNWNKGFRGPDQSECSDHPKIRMMLTGKYGPPISERHEHIQNKLGASFDNLISEWQFDEGIMVLKMLALRDRGYDTGFLTFDNPTIEREIDLRTNWKQQDKGKKAF